MNVRIYNDKYGEIHFYPVLKLRMVVKRRSLYEV